MQQPTSSVTLLSDFGTRDATVAVVKATLLQRLPQVAITDISHRIDPYDLQQGAYLLLSAYRYFANGTVHLCMIDVFAGESHNILLAAKDGQYFIAPDNGFLPLAFGNTMDAVYLCAGFSKTPVFREWINTAAEVIASVSARCDIPYEPFEITNTIRKMEPRAMPDGVECNVLYIDRYENVVLDITRPQFYEMVGDQPFRIKVMRAQDITSISENYNDVAVGEPLCRFNNAGFLEIAINRDKAATLLALKSFQGGNLRYQTVTILTGAAQASGKVHLQL
jgi:S-adenosylmethionine hydrolase